MCACATKQLIDNYELLHKDLEQFLSQLKTIDRQLSEISRLLKIPKEVSEKLSQFDDLLQVTYDLLYLVSLIPPAASSATQVRNSIGRAKPPVHKARVQANRIERKIAPYRKKIVKIQHSLRKLPPKLSQLDEFTVKERKLLQETFSNTGSLSASRYKKHELNRLDDFSGKVNTIIKPPQNSLEFIISQLDIMIQSLEVIDRACKSLSQILEPFLHLISLLDAMQAPLNAIKKALNKKVSFGFFSISIKSLLEASGKIPFFSQLMKAAMKVLDKLLAALNLNVDIKIPGINKFYTEMTKVLEHLNIVDEVMAKVENKVRDLLGGENYQVNISELAA